eukprot:2060426-Prorocentrum_lima.AAC.1
MGKNSVLWSASATVMAVCGGMVASAVNCVQYRWQVGQRRVSHLALAFAGVVHRGGGHQCRWTWGQRAGERSAHRLPM